MHRRVCLTNLVVFFARLWLSPFARAESDFLPPKKPTNEQPASSPNVVIGEHVVELGEDLYSVAMIYKVSAARLKELNGLNGTDLILGQRLKVPVPLGQLKPTPTAAVQEGDREKKSVATPKKGDSRQVVISSWGEPKGSMRGRASNEVLSYDQGLVFLENGRIVEIKCSPSRSHY